MEAKVIEYKNKKIISVDFRGAKSEQDIIKISQQGINLRGGISEVAGVMVNFTDVDNIYSETSVKEIKGAVDKYGKEKIALIGVAGINKTVMDGVNVYAGSGSIQYFNAGDKEEAKEWLVS